jgi:hypothetical protein
MPLLIFYSPFIFSPLLFTLAFSSKYVTSKVIIVEKKLKIDMSQINQQLSNVID